MGCISYRSHARTANAATSLSSLIRGLSNASMEKDTISTTTLSVSQTQKGGPSMKLQRLFDENFHLIPIRKDDKRPLTKHWNHIRLGVKETQNFLREGYNLAVVAGEKDTGKGP